MHKDRPLQKLENVIGCPDRGRTRPHSSDGFTRLQPKIQQSTVTTNDERLTFTQRDLLFRVSLFFEYSNDCAVSFYPCLCVMNDKDRITTFRAAFRNTTRPLQGVILSLFMSNEQWR